MSAKSTQNLQSGDPEQPTMRLMPGITADHTERGTSRRERSSRV